MWKTQILTILIALATCLSCFGHSRSTAAGVPILVYHRFDRQRAAPTSLKTATFRSQLLWLQNHHYRIVPLRTVLNGILTSQTPKPNVICITVDDGHRSVYTELFPLILQYRIPVTLFIYPSAISNAAYALTWDELREMQSSGLVEVQSHTYWHPDFRREKARLSPAACHSLVALQLNRSRQVLEERLGGRADLLAWPFGIVDPELEVAAREAGYLAAFGYCCGPVRAGTDRYAIPRIAVSNRDQGRLFAELLTGRSGGPTP